MTGGFGLQMSGRLNKIFLSNTSRRLLRLQEFIWADIAASSSKTTLVFFFKKGKKYFCVSNEQLSSRKLARFRGFWWVKRLCPYRVQELGYALLVTLTLGIELIQSFLRLVVSLNKRLHRDCFYGYSGNPKGRTVVSKLL